MKMKGAQIIIKVLLEQGVDTVFGYPGGAVLDIYDALYEESQNITHILTSHEQGAAHAADGYARASGKTGVVIATSGPGATNLVTGIAAAYMDSSPVVAITGNVKTSLLGHDSFQEVDIAGVTMPVTKHNFIVSGIDKLADDIRTAFRISNSGRKGPVLVDVPLDILRAEYEYTPMPKTEPEAKKAPDELSVQRAADAIAGSKNPLLYVGGGAISSGAAQNLVSFAHKLSIPVASSMMGLGAFPCNDPLYLGLIGMHGAYAANLAAHECDVLIAAGARFSDRVAGNRSEFAPNAKLVHIDIDPAEIDKNIYSQYHLKGDLNLTLKLLLERLPCAAHDEWIKHLLYQNVQKKPLSSEDEIPKAIIHAVAAASDKRTIIVTDVGQHQMWTAQYYPFEEPRTLITSGGLGAMGFGLGAAIGAKLAKKQDRVVLITGDGSFHMNCNELATLAKYNIPITVIVMNNGVLGMVRQWQWVFFGGRFSQTEPHRFTDFALLARAFGVEGMRITRRRHLQKRLNAALHSDIPVVVDCIIPSNAAVMPMIPPGGTVRDTILK
ncbi:MAG: biosynthetic-type acetolactate synthase large subunit [Clostridiales bacterium]|nr:biosynthetic-type acetolactate synthase large subunit [Clostridiales bacterium]